MPEDIAITSSKSDIDPCSHGRDLDHQKGVDGQTDSFLLYIVNDQWYKGGQKLIIVVKCPVNISTMYIRIVHMYIIKVNM